MMIVPTLAGWPKYSPPAEMLELLRKPKPQLIRNGKDGDEHALIEVVVLAKVLGADINFGYQEMGGVILKALNGKPVKGLADLAQKLELVAQVASKDGGDGPGPEGVELRKGVAEAGSERCLEFELSNSQRIVLDAKGCRETESEVLASYGLASATSEELHRES